MKKTTKPRSLFINPFYADLILSDRNKPNATRISYDLLRTVSRKNSIVGAIINTRIAQLSRLIRPTYDTTVPFDSILGYTITKKEKNNKELNKFERAERKRLMQFIQYMGFTPEWDRDDFWVFAQKVIRDRLEIGISAFEVVYSNTNKPIAVYAVDSTTIRYTDKDEKANGDYKQVIADNIVAFFDSREMGWGIANPTTAIEARDYGISEIEIAAGIIAAHINAETYNTLYFTQGTTSHGILNIKAPQISDNQLEALRRAYYALLTGTTNSWKTPILNSPEGIEYIKLSETNRDMEFGRWLQYLVTVLCGVYLIDPEEIGFTDRGAIATASHSLFNSSYQARTKLSQDKGFKPLLMFLERLINRYIIEPLNSDFQFKFLGVEGIDEKEVIDNKVKEVSNYKTMNEVRQELGLDPLPYGDIVLNPLWIQTVTQIQSAGFNENSEIEEDTNNASKNTSKDTSNNVSEKETTEDNVIDKEENSKNVEEEKVIKNNIKE